ncbi:MAG: S8 family serine peptidase, partial [Anaerolineae bacterium]|nr:S8 family serine peptidase [Anaerolineae bacterium]
MRPSHRWIRQIVCVSLLIGSLVAWPRGGNAGPVADVADFVPGEVIVTWAPTAEERAQTRPDQPGGDRSSPAWQRAAAQLAARTGRPVLDLAPEYGMARLAVPAGEEAAAAARLAALPWVAHAGLNYIARAAGYPNDPLIGEQWHMRRIAAPAAWDLTFGSYSLVVAVIDTGVDLGHAEFAGRLLPGYDYINGDNDPNDDNGHGTHVAGLIAAAANNGEGVAGLAANVKLLPLKVLDNRGNGNYYDIALAIQRAADAGAQVINLSLGGFASDPTLQEAINYALGKNVFIAAAAGNCAQGGAACLYQTNPDFYPAAYAGVVAVAASDHFDNWAAYSGFKPYIALAAPGGVAGDAVLSTVPGGYDRKYGTSMATAQVSAAAALILTYRPTAAPAQVAEILKETADKVGPYPYVGGRNDRFGAGRLNAGRAVRRAYPPSLQTPMTSYRFLLGGSITQTRAVFPILNSSEQPMTWQAAEVTGATWLTVEPAAGQTTFSSPSALTLKAGPTALGPGAYDAVVRIQTLSPFSSTTQIFVTLRVTDRVQRYFSPLLARQWRSADWVDPTSGGVAIYPTADLPALVDLPFPVTFYGRSYNRIYVSFKGYVSFSQPGAGPTVAQST